MGDDKRAEAEFEQYLQNSSQLRLNPACWAKLSGGNWLIVTDPSIAETAFIVVTGEFRIDDFEF